MQSPNIHLNQSQYDRKTWWLLGLAIFIIFGFCVTVPSLYVALARSGFLGDLLSPSAGPLLIGLIGLTALYCLLMIRQQSQINRIRRSMLVDQMELEQSRGRLAELTSLFQLGNTLHMDLPLETILEITVRRLASTLHSHDVSLFLYDPTSRKLPCKATFGLTARGAEPEVTVGEGAVGWVARHHEPILMRVTDKEARFAKFFESHPDAGSVLLLPVAVEKRCVAVLQVCRALKAEPFRLEHRDIGQLFADNVAAVIDRAQAMVRIRQTAAAAGTEPPPTAESATGPFRDLFLTTATSELKTPLATIVAYSEVLDQNEGKMTPAMRKEFSDRLRDEAQRTMVLVDDVLDLVRLEMGRYLLDLHFTGVNQIARAAIDLAKPMAEARGITMDADLDPAIPDQHLDPAKLRQSILHLLRNAVRLSPAKGRVRLKTSINEQGIQVEVHDAGPSIPAEAAASVFELESVGERHGKRCGDGMGFGLHLARRFVELHGGQVGAGPSPEGGATFWLVLPRGEDLSSLIGSDSFAEDLAKK
jgi:signal transduction histidine kinase